MFPLLESLFRAILSLLNPIGLHEAGTGNRCAQILHSLPLGPWISFSSSLSVAGVPDGATVEAKLSAAPSIRQQHMSPLLGLVRRPWRQKSKVPPKEAVKPGAPGALKAALGLMRTWPQIKVGCVAWPRTIPTPTAQAPGGWQSCGRCSPGRSQVVKHYGPQNNAVTSEVTLPMVWPHAIYYPSPLLGTFVIPSPLIRTPPFPLPHAFVQNTLWSQTARCL